MKPLWSPRKATIVTCVLVFVGILVAGGVWAGVTNPAHAEAAGEKVGRALVPITVIAGIIAYFVQRSRIHDKK